MKAGDRVSITYGIPTGSCTATFRIIGPGSRGGTWRLRSERDRSIELVAEESTFVPAAPERARSRVSDPDTAVAAGVLAAASLTRAQWLVLADPALAEAGRDGLMDHDHEVRNGLKSDSAGKRRLELLDRGLVEDTGRRRTTERGRRARVWRITEHGIAVWQSERRRGAA